ncbi:MAG TPA: Spy/CpxP family protein refolding chaperone [Adhaeribacter sp.]|nr:Spy/CpxP family protein refolding chaperone [Adhaeribacter sp.]
MKTLRLFTFLIGFLLVSFFTQAQDRQTGERGKKIEAARTAFLTDKMNLNPEQAQKFWPLYNEYDARRKELRRQGRPFRGQNLEAINDAQLKEQLEKMFDNRQKELDLEKEYASKFQKVITVQQLAALYQGEREFTRVLIKKLHDKRNGGSGKK